MYLKDKRILVTGGTGSLGKTLVRRLLAGDMGTPKKVIVLSRDEAKQHNMRMEYLHQSVTTDEVIYNNFKQILEFRIGDVRDYHDVCAAIKSVDIVVNAAALKQVPTCEYFPGQAVQTNCVGVQNIVNAIIENQYPVKTVLGVSTDKACKPVNVMGMTKAIQERIFISANVLAPETRFVCVRYGNVLASRGSVIPLFHEQIKNGGPVTLTNPKMTRFLLSLEQAVDLIFAALKGAYGGETYIPRVPSATVENIASALIGDRGISVDIMGERPGEKLHEILISEEECRHTISRDKYYVILPMLPELCSTKDINVALTDEYSSGDEIASLDETVSLLKAHNLLLDQVNIADSQELLV
ncbi:MAG: polysaccharide biosynthesis protein [Gammaproteobacteria bacterium]